MLSLDNKNNMLVRQQLLKDCWAKPGSVIKLGYLEEAVGVTPGK